MRAPEVWSFDIQIPEANTGESFCKQHAEKGLPAVSKNPAPIKKTATHLSAKMGSLAWKISKVKDTPGENIWNLPCR